MYPNKMSRAFGRKTAPQHQRSATILHIGYGGLFCMAMFLSTPKPPLMFVAKCKSDFQWGRVIWSDETKIKLFGNKHQRWFWRSQKHSHIEKTPIPNVKYGGGSLMFWGCFSSKGPGHLVRIHGIMDSIKYQQILNENLTAPSSKLKMGRGWTFQQDSTPQNQHKNGSRTAE